MTSLGEELTAFLESVLDELLDGKPRPEQPRPKQPRPEQPRPEQPPISPDIGDYYNIIFNTPNPKHNDTYKTQLCKSHFNKGTTMVLSNLKGLYELIKHMRFLYERDINTYTTIMYKIKRDIETTRKAMFSYEKLYMNIIKYPFNATILDKQCITYTSLCNVFEILTCNFTYLITYNLDHTMYMLKETTKMITYGVDTQVKKSIIVYKLHPIIK